MVVCEELGDDVDAVGGDIACGDEQVEQDWEGVVGLALIAEPVECYQADFAVCGDIRQLDNSLKRLDPPLVQDSVGVWRPHIP